MPRIPTTRRKISTEVRAQARETSGSDAEPGGLPGDALRQEASGGSGGERGSAAG